MLITISATLKIAKYLSDMKSATMPCAKRSYPFHRAQEMTEANPILSNVGMPSKCRTKYQIRSQISIAVTIMRNVPLRGKLNAMPEFSA